MIIRRLRLLSSQPSLLVVQRFQKSSRLVEHETRRNLHLRLSTERFDEIVTHLASSGISLRDPVSRKIFRCSRWRELATTQKAIKQHLAESRWTAFNLYLAPSTHLFCTIDKLKDGIVRENYDLSDRRSLRPGSRQFSLGRFCPWRSDRIGRVAHVHGLLKIVCQATFRPRTRQQTAANKSCSTLRRMACNFEMKF